MLIYTKELNWEKLKAFSKNPDRVVKEVESVIPKWAAHINNIYNNQRYFAAIYLRNVLAIPFKERMAVVNALTDGISLSGLTAYFVSIEELIDYCDKEDLLEALKRLSNAELID